MHKQHLIGLTLAVAVVTPHLYSSSVIEARAAETVHAPQTSSQEGVTVTVTPQGFSSGAITWDFAITLGTHIQPLGDDLTQSSVLFVDGKTYQPVGWEGTPPGGHHRKGVLRFKAVTPQPQSLELQIRRVGEASPRIFRWQLK